MNFVLRIPPLLLPLALGALSAARPAQGAECRPVVTLQGPAELTEPLSRLLLARGVGGARDPSCPELRAQVERRGARIAVTISELQSPRSQRDFESEALAATFIESWTRSDLSAPLLEGFAAAALSAPPRSPVMAAPVAPAPKVQPRLSVAGAGSFAGATDRSLWVGGQVSACARAGAVCLGGLLALRAPVREAEVPPPPPVAGPPRRLLDYATLVLVRVPLRTRYVTWLPGAGFGAGFSSVQPPVAMPDAQPGLISPRARLELGAALPLRLGFAVDLGASADLAFGPDNLKTFGLSLGFSYSGVRS